MSVRADGLAAPPDLFLFVRPATSPLARFHFARFAIERTGRVSLRTAPSPARRRAGPSPLEAGPAGPPLNGRQPARPPRDGRLPLLGGELELSQAHVHRRHLDAFVL